MGTDVRAVITTALLRQSPGITSEAKADVALTALAAYGVELVTDLPNVDDVDLAKASSADGHRRMAAWHLAVARRLEAEPDPADVAAMTSLLAGAYQADVSDPRDLARILLLAGVRLPDGGAE